VATESTIGFEAFLDKAVADPNKVDYCGIAVVSMALVVYNSGGVRIIPSFILSLMIIALLILKLTEKFRLTRRPVIIIMPFFLFLLGVNKVLSKSPGTKYYIIQVSFIVIGTLMLGIYGKKEKIAGSLYLALQFFMWHALLSLVFGLMLSGYAHLHQIFGSTEKFIPPFFFYPEFDTVPGYMRVQGLFWEPGVLQYYMNLLFLLALHYRNKVVASFAFLTVLSTFSTTGYLILAFSLAYLLGKKVFRMNFRKGIIAAVGGLLIGLPLMALVYFNVYEKIEGGGRRSTAVRFYDLITGLNIVAEHPLTGIGLDPETLISQHSQVGYEGVKLTEAELEEKGLSNGFLVGAATWGLPIFGLMLLFLYRQPLLPIEPVLFFGVTCLFLAGEPLFASPFITLLIMAGADRFLSFRRARDGA